MNNNRCLCDSCELSMEIIGAEINILGEYSMIGEKKTYLICGDCAKYLCMAYEARREGSELIEQFKKNNKR